MPVIPAVRRHVRLVLDIIIPRRRSQFCIVIIHIDSRPLLRRSFIVHARQAIAIIERPITDRSYAVRNRDTRQTTAIFERLLTDRSHAVAYRYARQTTAIIERPLSDRRYAANDTEFTPPIIDCPDKTLWSVPQATIGRLSLSSIIAGTVMSSVVGA